MPDSQPIDAERGLQPVFRIIEPLQAFTLFAAILLLGHVLIQPATRTELGRKSSGLVFTPVTLPGNFGAMQLRGAWQVESADPRLGGISALAIDQGALLALTDSGVVIRLPKPGSGSGRATVDELPDGPGDPGFKVSRDSESLARDPAGRGWWVGFENRNQLWLYDREFGRALKRIIFARRRWGRNSGIEGMATGEKGLVIVPELGGQVIHIDPPRQSVHPIAQATGRISDAVRLPNGELLILRRSLGFSGFVTILSALETSGDGYRIAWSQRLGFGPRDNVEAIAVEPLAPGKVRLWMMTDDNFRPPLRTLLVAVDLMVRPLPDPSSRRRA